MNEHTPIAGISGGIGLVLVLLALAVQWGTK